MTEQEIQLFNDSFERTASDTRFFDIFYEKFIASSGEVRRHFESTDLRRQKHMLKASLFLTMQAIVGRKETLDHLDDTAKRHSHRNLDIRPELYDLWLDSMIDAVRICDPEVDHRVELVWRRAMGKAIDFCVARYE